MHRIANTKKGNTPTASGVVLIEQNPAPIVILTAADSDIQTLANCLTLLPSGFPQLRVASLLQLQQQLTIDFYADTVLNEAQVIVLRLLGGRSYWSYGLEIVKEIADNNNAKLLVVPGDDQPDPELISHSTVSLTIVNRLWHYFSEGGAVNLANGLKYLTDATLGTNYIPDAPQIVTKVGIYHTSATTPTVAILFYRAHFLAGNLLPIDALIEALQIRNTPCVAIFISSLRDLEVQAEIVPDLTDIQLILNTTSFSVPNNFWEKLNIPVFQVILSSSTVEEWEASFQGLQPRDLAMNVALPEVDGRIITRAISFKLVQNWHPQLETPVVIYQPRLDRVNFVVDLAINWLKLAQIPASEQKIALIVANYPNRDGRIANGVGLDTPASCLAILQALESEGYQLAEIPATVSELMESLIREKARLDQFLTRERYQEYFTTLPVEVQQGISDRWGEVTSETIPIPGKRLGNIFIGIQPSRGYDLDPSLNYHAPDLEPTHAYLAYYFWLKEVFGAQAIVHLGKHGNLEWLPGKSLALSSGCYPEIALTSIPHFYPFIVNDPGEGTQAKRRSHAVILDHLTPPLTRAELYGPLQQLELLLDEYAQAESINPGRLKLISEKIMILVQESNLAEDLGVDNPELESFLNLASGYLCELKEAQIRDGLHIFGSCPQGRQLRDLIIAIARFPSGDRLGLTRALAQDLSLDFDPLIPSPVVATLEAQAQLYIEQLLDNCSFNPPPGEQTHGELHWIKTRLLPSLKATDEEINNLLKGLRGEYVPSGPSGAPSRGKPEVLPTGRNFYSVDIRAIPTQTAWDVGRRAAEAVIERYTQEQGEYPQTLAISIWGTSTMRTGGEDVAQVLALLGVRPIWEGINGRVVDFEVLAASGLGRPRVDVTVRVSGFFRDSFPNLLNLLYQAIEAVVNLKEEKNINPLAAKARQEQEFWQNQGLTAEQAQERSRYRIFGSKPGAYGAGLQGLIESQNWTDTEDLARAYLNWSCYAYTYAQELKAIAAPEAFTERLRDLAIVLHNQDNREHDLLDSDDYYQFQGGLTAAVRAITGKNPQVYFGDNSLPHHPRVRSLKEEITRVYRSRVVNPKWIAGVMRHGYKGAFEIAATVDYLFAYDATTNCVEDYLYQGVAEAYIFNPEVQAFMEQHNPWALRDMAERLLEAQQRGLWQNPHPATIEQLRDVVHQAEAIVENFL
ncbi:cobaltochelatase subunit CobN [Gloeocapsa sp. PCC 73106]|uniref:cobaltochelatase subunit CobN n=1 Tax=Gloeocapsa sp. PCC 73106 TaxID=102232 RepID=UPI0002ABA83A|nr:cobaltochelatase subunit CobN [Gloeocapsa sp. PCC 73106]ELR99609.1 cobaltochelatase, CobN subunit [Gloeocapsa sp. PCC 73106]